MTRYTVAWLEYHAPRNEDGEIIPDAPDDWFVQEGYPYCTASQNDGGGDGWHELECSAEVETKTLKEAHEWANQNTDSASGVYTLTDPEGRQYTEEDYQP